MIAQGIAVDTVDRSTVGVAVAVVSDILYIYMTVQGSQ